MQNLPNICSGIFTIGAKFEDSESFCPFPMAHPIAAEIEEIVKNSSFVLTPKTIDKIESALKNADWEKQVWGCVPTPKKKINEGIDRMLTWLKAHENEKIDMA